MSKYLVVSTAVTDQIFLAGGTPQAPKLGGAGIYALAGIKVWNDEVKIVTGVGADFMTLHGSWFKTNGLTTTGLLEKDDHTPVNKIQYFADGEREETPLFGPDHYRLMKPAAADVACHCSNIAGIYVFRNMDQEFWEHLIQLRNQVGFRLMWEIAADVATPEDLADVREILQNVDLFSINIQEAFHLFSTNKIETVITNLQALELPLVYFRMGAKGAYMITRNHVQHVPSIENVGVIDPTGGGNSSSGAVLVGFCEGKDPLMSGIMGSISASFTITQYGPPPLLNVGLRESAHKQMTEAYANFQEN